MSGHRGLRITVGVASLATLTGAELFASLARAHLTRARLQDALDALQAEDGDPELALSAIRFLQSAALELALRDADQGDGPTWEDAQTWEITADTTDGAEDPLAVERREYRAQAAVASGLPPDLAETLPVADVDALVRARAGGD